MAEDQSYNGDIWTQEASILLSEYKWEQIGDQNMDVPGADKKDHGLDAIFKFEDPHCNNNQGILFEAKRYATTSFTQTHLQNWINTIDKKILSLRRSKDFLDMYPNLGDCKINSGLIAIWFHDYENFFSYRNQFEKYLKGISVSNRKRMQGYNKIFVITNDTILRLCSVINTIRKISLNNSRVLFYYPTLDFHSAPIIRKESLSLNYFFSKFILCEEYENDNLKNRIVFYFGNRDMQSIILLKNALLKLSYLDTLIPLKIYFYKEDTSNFRKIAPEVKKLFNCISLEMNEMTHLAGLPDWTKK